MLVAQPSCSQQPRPCFPDAGRGALCRRALARPRPGRSARMPPRLATAQRIQPSRPLRGGVDGQRNFVDIAAAWQLSPSSWSTPVLIHRNHSGMLKFLARFEPHIIAVMLAVFATCDRGRGLFVDSGANDGAWSLMAGVAGCRVIAVEPQPQCTRLLRSAVRVNGLSERVSIHQSILAARPIETQVPTDRCGGDTQFLPDGRVTTAFGWDERRFNRSLATAPRATVRSASLDDLLQRGRDVPATVDLWHIDTEGAELVVLRSAAAALSAARVRRVLIEVRTDRWVKFGVPQRAGLAEARQLFSKWRCVNACSNAPFDWSRSPDAKRDCARRLVNTGVTSIDVYCVHPLAAPVGREPGLRALHEWFAKG